MRSVAKVPAATVPAQDSDARLRSRRQSLRQIGRFAAMTAPAMLVLLEHGTAAAESEEGGSHGVYNEHTRRHSNG